MSTLSSALNSLSTVSVTDFYQRFLRSDASDRHYLAASRAFTVFWAALSVPIAFAFVDSGGSILERLSEVASFFVGAKLAMFGLGFLSRHTTERGLLVGVAAGFMGLYAVVAGIPFLDWTPPDVAWPWYVVIGGGINVVVAWTASVLLDGFRSEWPEQTIPGQRRRFREQGSAESQDGWYLVPGRVDRPSWALLVFFVVTLTFLAAFGRLTGA